MWLDSTDPLSTTPLRRLVIAQDTGSAIRGAARIDYFWGWRTPFWADDHSRKPGMSRSSTCIMALK